MRSVFKVGRRVVGAGIIASAVFIVQTATATAEYSTRSPEVAAKAAPTRGDGYWNRKTMPPLLCGLLIWLHDELNVPKP